MGFATIAGRGEASQEDFPGRVNGAKPAFGSSLGVLWGDEERAQSVSGEDVIDDARLESNGLRASSPIFHAQSEGHWLVGSINIRDFLKVKVRVTWVLVFGHELEIAEQFSSLSLLPSAPQFLKFQTQLNGPQTQTHFPPSFFSPQRGWLQLRLDCGR